MLGGYMGKLLFVDLKQGKLAVEGLEEKVYRDFIGGYGIGARILYSRQKAGVDPLGPDNLLGFITGPLTGSTNCWGSRFAVVAKSPLTGGWGDSNCGGDLGAFLKFCGYDAIFCAGISPTPVYLFVKDGLPEIRDAAHLWGKDTYETIDLLKKELGDQISIATIGPPGENKSLIASIIVDKNHAAARAGLGAVMGSKHLKAIVVAKGTQAIPIANPRGLKEATIKFLANIKTNTLGINYGKFGTCGITAAAVLSGDAPTKYWAGGGVVDYPNFAAVSDYSVINLEYKKDGCWHCPNPCGGLMQAGKQYNYPKGADKPEYETLAAFGPLCLNDNLESIIMANDMCNQYGVDTMSAGALVAFAMECYEKGAITQKETGGIELTWGNHSAVIAILEKIVKREGLGDVLADGVKVAAQKIGKGTEKYALHVHGEECAYHDPRFNSSFGLGFVCDSGPGRHNQSGLGAPVSLMGGLKLPATAMDRSTVIGKGPFEADLRNIQHIANCSGMCSFGYWIMPREAIPDLLSLVTGWKVSQAEVLVTGERVYAIRQAFNLREGIIPARDFQLPDRVAGDPPLSKGPLAGRVVKIKELSEEYYNYLGWDPKTGAPTKKRWLELGLEDAARDLEKG